MQPQLPEQERPEGVMAVELAEHFMAQHRECDARWADVEATVSGGDAAAIAEAWSRFDEGMRQHLAAEEEVLFPAFDDVMGLGGGGPTQVMRTEHSQMRGVLDQMTEAVARGDAQELLDQGDTLLMLIQQHNTKEEGVLYPAAERALAGQWPALRERLAHHGGAP
jgi:hemerythrin-like domain-containing protein